MEIGEQIKVRRQELNMTQEMLANQLNVGRSTVSNWEIGRNYPDLQLIVSISEALDLPLDILLGKESKVVKEISRDTNIRKAQRWKVRIMAALLILVSLTGLFVLYKTLEYRDISSPSQIVSFKEYEDRLEIVTDLPFYRSVVGYTIGGSLKGDDTIEISLATQIDLSMEHQQKIIVETDGLEEDMGISELKRVDVIDQNGVIKSFKL